MQGQPGEGDDRLIRAGLACFELARKSRNIFLGGQDEICLVGSAVETTPSLHIPQEFAPRPLTRIVWGGGEYQRYHAMQRR